MKLEVSRQAVGKDSNIKFHENPSIGSRLIYRRTDGRTDRHDVANS
jgi:hypothetical protein